MEWGTAFCWFVNGKYALRRYIFPRGCLCFSRGAFLGCSPRGCWFVRMLAEGLHSERWSLGHALLCPCRKHPAAGTRALLFPTHEGPGGWRGCVRGCRVSCVSPLRGAWGGGSRLHVVGAARFRPQPRSACRRSRSVQPGAPRASPWPARPVPPRRSPARYREPRRLTKGGGLDSGSREHAGLARRIAAPACNVQLRLHRCSASAEGSPLTTALREIWGPSLRTPPQIGPCRPRLTLHGDGDVPQAPRAPSPGRDGIVAMETARGRRRERDFWAARTDSHILRAFATPKYFARSLLPPWIPFFPLSRSYLAD